MRDKEIRHALLQDLHKKYHNDSNTLIVEEFGLCQGNARVDIAVINGTMHGYEIKSEKDTLNRLYRQQAIYSKVLDYVTVIASSRHLQRINEVIPDWWGLNEAKWKNQTVKIVEVRPHRENNEIEPTALVQLLWRDEAFDILERRNLHKGLTRKPRALLWKRIIECLTFDELHLEIRVRIKSREFWRSDQPQM
jgi:hypothetical protein